MALPSGAAFLKNERGRRDDMGEVMDNELDIYRHQGFANPMGLGQAPALLIID
jgi:hypothetical protein